MHSSPTSPSARASPNPRCFHFREKGCTEGVTWEAGNTPPSLPFNQTPSFICSWPPACMKVSRVERTYTSYHLISAGTLCSLQRIATVPLHSLLSTETCHVPLLMAENSHISVESRAQNFLVTSRLRNSKAGAVLSSVVSEMQKLFCQGQKIFNTKKKNIFLDYW